MSKKVERALYGPSWTEVILGALLSVLLGGVLSAVFLVFKQVTAVKEIPKEPVPGMVYYIEGSHDGSRGRALAAKQKVFLKGGSVAVNEDEINLALIPVNAPPAKGADPAKPAPESSEILSAGAPNVRIHDGMMQLSTVVHVRYSLVGVDTTVLVQAEGKIVRQGDQFGFEPSTLYVGSCPVQRLPMVSGLVLKKFLNAQRFPADLATAWGKLAEVSIEGSTLKLSMPQ